MENTFRCSGGHSYDIAREGYVNLLLANQKASSSPGDTKAMARSRRAFLDKGYYELLSDRIIALASAAGRESAGAGVLEAGCGEGYYLHRLTQTFPAGSGSYGLDISKETVKLGAAKYKNSQFVVGNIHQTLPFASCSFNIVLNVFAPRNPAEFARVLRPSGVALVVVPAEGHLAALHDALRLPRIDGDKARRAIADFDGALVPDYSETIRYRRILPSEDVSHLVQMMPAIWHLSDQVRMSMSALSSLEIEFAFTLLVLRPLPLT